MNRSEINDAIKGLLHLAGDHGYHLPPFAHWTPEAWKTRGREFDEIRLAGLGWDVTDFGKGDFARFGLTLFTVRNGRVDVEGTKPYCEKLMMVRENQVTPMHFHWNKTEDIINRGGGNLVCKLYLATDDDRLSETPVRFSADGRAMEVPAGYEHVLRPGESITLTPRLYHAFWGETGGGPVLVGEVSAVNDDANDNRFLEALPRFPKIEEDAPAIHLLCSEYPAGEPRESGAVEQ